MPTEKEGRRFFDMILGLDSQIKERLINFESRIFSLKGMIRIFVKIGVTLDVLIKTRSKDEREKMRLDAIQAAEEAQEFLSSRFASIIEIDEADTAAEEKGIAQITQILSGMIAEQMNEYEILNSSPIGGAAREKIERIMKEISEATAHEGVDIRWDQHFNQTIDFLRKKIIPEERQTLKDMYSHLSELKDRLKLLKPLEPTDRIQQLNTAIRVNYENIDRLMRTEKMRVIDPLYGFLRMKNRELLLARHNIERAKSEGAKITKNDIIRDVHTFTDTHETHRYLNELVKHWDYLDNKAKLLFSQIHGRATSKSKRIVTELQKLAGLGFVDALTGLNNRGAFDRDRYEWIEHDKIAPTSLIMIDVDKFKEFNDTYGHPIGDEVLKFVAATIANVAGKKLSYRPGGEEFSVLLPEKSIEEALAIAERVRREIEAGSVPIMEGINQRKLVEPEKKKDRITISAGVTEFPLHAKNKDHIVQKADAALYVAKKAGRNRVIVSE